MSRSHLFPGKIKSSSQLLVCRGRESAGAPGSFFPGYVHLDPGVCRAQGTMRGRTTLLGVIWLLSNTCSSPY